MYIASDHDVLYSTVKGHRQRNKGHCQITMPFDPKYSTMTQK